MISGDIDCLHHFHGQSDKRTDFGGIDVDGSELLLPGTLAGLAGLAIGSLAAGVWAMTVDADSPTPGQLTVTQATAPSATRLARGGELVHLKVRVKDVDAKHSSGVSLSVSFPMAGPYRDIPRSQSASCQRNFLHPNKSEECTISTTATPRQVESAVVQVSIMTGATRSLRRKTAKGFLRSAIRPRLGLHHRSTPGYPGL